AYESCVRGAYGVGVSGDQEPCLGSVNPAEVVSFDVALEPRSNPQSDVAVLASRRYHLSKLSLDQLVTEAVLRLVQKLFGRHCSGLDVHKNLAPSIKGRVRAHSPS